MNKGPNCLFCRSLFVLSHLAIVVFVLSLLTIVLFFLSRLKIQSNNDRVMYQSSYMVWLAYGVQRNFQQYFNYIVEVSFIGV
jgi:hypothetical protein